MTSDDSSLYSNRQLVLKIGPARFLAGLVYFSSNEAMYPILARLEAFFVYSFTAVFAVGLIIGSIMTYRQNRRQMLAGWQDGGLVALFCGWVGGRLSFVLLNWDIFATRPSDIWQLWRGGLTAYGSLFGGLLGLAIWCWRGKRPFLSYAALFSPALWLLIVTGWAACWAEGCAYGATTTLGPLAANLPDTFGIFAVRYQTQLLGICLNLLALILVLLWQKRGSNGRLFPLTLLLANLIHFALTFLRGDAAPVLAGWRLDSWLALFFAIVGLILLQYGRLQNGLYKNLPE